MEGGSRHSHDVPLNSFTRDEQEVLVQRRQAAKIKRTEPFALE